MNVYGLTLDSISVKRTPRPRPTPWGDWTDCACNEFFALRRLHLTDGAASPLQYDIAGPTTYFVESGRAVLHRTRRDGGHHLDSLDRGAVVDIGAGEIVGFVAASNAVVYAFSGPLNDQSRFVAETSASAGERFRRADVTWETLPRWKQSTTDVRDKYWGGIETIVSDAYAGKRMRISGDKQSSLEFHCKKNEAYYVESGRLKVGLRVGRGENYSVVLEAGDAFDIPPGLMHMRIALTDCVLFEISTPDSDADSYLVADGQTYHHLESTTTAQEGDIDGTLRR